MTFDKRLAQLRDGDADNLLKIQRGIEKESLRITPDGHLSQRPHPQSLGSALMHPSITTDYSEALIELITPTFNGLQEVLEFLNQLHRLTYHHIDDELLWVNSLPCLLGDEKAIPIAEFGTSNIGRMKHVYRRGLDLRYGRNMQIIAGIHYNFSVPDVFWKTMELSDNGPDQHAVSNAYMAGIRNFHRFSWLLFYLFGASPAACRSFFSEADACGLVSLGSHTLYAKNATSLRMSNYGYRNPVQSEICINHNSVDSYIETLSETINTPFASYEKFGVRSNGDYIQLNTNLLQIENEYYSVIRPKRRTNSMEKPTHALRDRGVEYLEIRCLDLDPYEPIGISEVQSQFLDLLILFCLLYPSPPMPDSHHPIISANKDATVLNGRNPELILKRNGERISLATWGKEILDHLQPIAERFDQALQGDGYERCLKMQRDKLDNPELTPSARILNELIENDESFFAFAMRKAEEAKAELTKEPLDSATISEFAEVATRSIQEQIEMESRDEEDFDQFLKAYFSQ